MYATLLTHREVKKITVMNQQLQYIVEPRALLLTWQPADLMAPNRARRAVAKIEKDANDTVTFKYLTDTRDYELAQKAGFKGHPAFKEGNSIISTGVIEALLRRLPPRAREDFPEFLRRHKLPSPFEYNDFALLAYTGARLPSDGFAIIPIFDAEVTHCEYILEVAGFRHQPNATIENTAVGSAVEFMAEPDNPHDEGAIAIMHRQNRIGYVSRVFKDTFKLWMDNRKLSATIDRINGTDSRPLVYLKIEVKPK